MAATEDVLDWDEAQDPSQAPKPKAAPWAKLGVTERQMLDALSDGDWIREGALRTFLHWGRFQFFLVTLRLVIAGWIEARPANSFLTSEYRLRPSTWQ